MLGRLMPREGNFFKLFNAHAERIVEGSRELSAMIGGFSELDAHAQRIDAAERAADKVTHECITLLHKTFITPFDRDQIHALITTMDDILDLIQDVAESVALYDLRSVTPEAKQLAEICQMCCERVKTVVGLLTNVKRSEAILRLCEEIDRLDAHVAQGRELIASGGAVGRRLDFLAQEFNREANTLCSKSNDAGLTRTGLELKTVIDQMREQVQNIE